MDATCWNESNDLWERLHIAYSVCPVIYKGRILQRPNGVIEFMAESPYAGQTMRTAAAWIKHLEEALKREEGAMNKLGAEFERLEKDLAAQRSEAGRSGVTHEISYLQDTVYDHLSQPRCSCGWEMGGFTAYPKSSANDHLRAHGQVADQ